MIVEIILVWFLIGAVGVLAPLALMVIFWMGLAVLQILFPENKP